MNELENEAVDDKGQERRDWELIEQQLQPVLLDLLADGPLPLSEATGRLYDAGNLNLLLELFHPGHEDDDMDRQEMIEHLCDDVGGIAESSHFYQTRNGLIASTRHLLDGIVLTHRLDDQELAAGALRASPDLSLIDFDCERGEALDLATGGTIEWHRRDAERALVSKAGVYQGPEGWLSAFSPGELIALRRNGRTVTVSAIAEPEVNGTEEAKALREAFDDMTPPGQADELQYVAMETLIRWPSLFRRSTPPIAELLPTIDLEHRDPRIGRVGEEWSALGADLNRILLSHIAKHHDLDSCCQSALEDVHSAYAGLRDGSAPLSSVDLRPIARDLRHGDVAQVFSEFLFGSFLGIELGNLHLDNVELFAGSIAVLPGADAAGGLYLLGVARQWEGRALDAEAKFTDALHADTEFAPAAFALADYTAERGDAVRTLSLLRRAGNDEAREGKFLTATLQPLQGAGRNDPCPCGSGRKFKTCCQTNPSLSSQARTTWLTIRLFRFLQSPRRRAGVTELRDIATAADPDMEIDKDVVMFLTDVAAFEGGGIDDYKAERGPLLSASDHTMLEQWQAAPRDLWEITATAKDELALRNVSTARKAIISLPDARSQTQVGNVLLCRIANDGDRSYLVRKGLVVHPDLLDETVEMVKSVPDAHTWAAWVAKVSAAYLDD